MERGESLMSIYYFIQGEVNEVSVRIIITYGPGFETDWVVRIGV